MTGELWWAPPQDPRRSRGRTWTARGLVTGVTAAVVVVVAGVVALTSPHTPDVTVTSQGWDTRPTVRAVAVGCGPVQHVETPMSKVGWVPYTGDLPYYPAVPVAGWFAQDRPEPGDVSATPEQVLHGMWFGERAIWVAADAPGSVTTALVELVEQNPQWSATVRVWPADRVDRFDGLFAVASWGVTQACDTPDREVIGGLFTQAPPAPGADGTPPPAAFDQHDTRATE